MKFRNLRNWEGQKNLEGLIFFAQLLEELLFDYSLDTYKPSAMNSGALCVEAIHVIRNIEDKVAPAHNVKYILDELCLNLKHDSVARCLIPLQINAVINKLKNKTISLSDKSTLLKILASHLSPQRYKVENEVKLTEAITEGAKKSSIRNLARSYITTLIDCGYSSKYIAATSRKFFYMGDSKISAPGVVTDYFSLFPYKNQKYQAVFIASEIFCQIEQSCKSFEITLSKTPPIDEINGQRVICQKLGDGEIYLLVPNLKSKDVHAARAAAQRRVEAVSTLLSLFHHKDIAAWRDAVLIVNEGTGKSRNVKAPTNTVLKCIDYRTKHAAEKLNHLVENFSLSERKSFLRFFRSAELHRLSLKNSNPETQLLNLWVALETLVPAKPHTGHPRINIMVDGIVPFLSCLYIPRLIRNLRKDMFEWDARVTLNALTNITADTNDAKLFLLLTDEAHLAAKNQLLTDFKEFYLLRNRFYYLSEQLSSPKKAAELLRTHWCRVDWQIRRIYRARNYIVHSGYAPTFVDTLLKNLHDYLDITLNAVIEMASCKGMFGSIDQSFEYADMVAHEQLSNFGAIEDGCWDSHSRQILLSALPGGVRPTDRSSGRP